MKSKSIAEPLTKQEYPSRQHCFVTAEEAYSLLQTELARFLTVAVKLGTEDWHKPTACFAWTVRDILAHQAGGYASGTGYKELLRQISNRLKPGQLPEDAINEFQLQERADKSPAELIIELRWVGPVATRKWAFQFRPLKLIRMDVLDFNIFASGRYTYEEARSRITITGNVSSAEEALKKILVVY